VLVGSCPSTRWRIDGKSLALRSMAKFLLVGWRPELLRDNGIRPLSG
jgi:hypothetical protein